MEMVVQQPGWSWYVVFCPTVWLMTGRGSPWGDFQRWELGWRGAEARLKGSEKL